MGLMIMQIPDEMLKEIRESGYDQELVFTQIRKLRKTTPITINKINLFFKISFIGDLFLRI